MGEATIYGYSDDLIEVEGEVCEELYADYGKPTMFRVGDYKLQAEYDKNGVWKFDVVDKPSGLMYTHLNAGESDEHKDYTEVVKVGVSSGSKVEKL